MMDTTRFTDCPKCGALMDVDCDWADWKFAQPHPQYHPERVIATGLADVPNVVNEMSTESIDKAFQGAIDNLL